MAITLFDGTAAGTTLSKTLWPGAQSVTLPTPNSGQIASLTVSGNTVGGVIARIPTWKALNFNFAAVGNADVSLTVEIGSIEKSGAMARVMASAVLQSITTSGTIANVNPFTGDATASVTWRLFDLVTLTKKTQMNQVNTNVGGLDDNTPSEIMVVSDEAPYYYVLVTNLSTLTRVLCAVTPVAAIAT